MAIAYCYWHLVVKNGSSHCYWHLVVNNGNFTFLLLSSGQEWQFHMATDIYWSGMAISHCYWQLVVKNGNCTMLLTSSIQECIFTLLLTCTTQEWEIHIATNIQLSWNSSVTLLLTCSGTRMANSDCYWHLVVKNGNFTLLWYLVVKNGNCTLLLTFTVHEWLFHIATDIFYLGMYISHCYWPLLFMNHYFTLLLTSSGQEWQFHIPTDI